MGDLRVLEALLSYSVRAVSELGAVAVIGSATISTSECGAVLNGSSSECRAVLNGRRASASRSL
ncbi:hypothetical protein GCM10022226_01120 [Sphaerisporangium flaviroseum]|uniref:Uncharacterized protein n=1 Tax=Sphaerisporangium flaviroseum TaxID=509199 RepID=A0ABP7H9H3_9ACTN